MNKYKKNIELGKKLKKQYKKILKNMIIIGITGTNGKTTTTTLLYKYFRNNNINVTLIGTNGIYINDNYYETINTTPGIEKIYEIINESYKKNVQIIIMEISSHGIDQNRIYGLKFKIKAITNITVDHLDYHKSFKQYKKTKLSFLKKSKIILNDNIKFRKINLLHKIYKYGKKNSNFNMSDLHINKDGIKFILNIKNKSYLIKSNLQGEFNCYNILLFISILYVLKQFDYYKIISFLNNKISIDGRMQAYTYLNKNIIIDYAHTPDGMEKVLQYAKEIYQNKIITIFGCGGNRDQSKRKIMGEVCSKYSDYAIITSDNPRNEYEQDIVNDILKGVTIPYSLQLNRKKAIDLGLNKLKNYNVLFILGRGNEEYINIKDNKIKFNDIKYIEEFIKSNE